MDTNCQRSTVFFDDADMVSKGYTKLRRGISSTVYVENPGAVYGIAVQRKGALHSKYEDGVSDGLGLETCTKELVCKWQGLLANFDLFADLGGESLYWKQPQWIKCDISSTSLNIRAHKYNLSLDWKIVVQPSLLPLLNFLVRGQYRLT
ncbi:uncharacterized protein N7518_003691, partial [Penicillium psychrosexuale]|uniref:uncharacterized protein n=1 Tax=Penicillium psychrosexuale TaxID=1002107 RepID=UPI002544D7CF